MTSARGGRKKKEDILAFELFIPCHRQVDACTFNAVDLCHIRLPYPFRSLAIPGDALIGRQRSRIAYQFMQGRLAPYMIFVDSDIEFEPEDLGRLYSHLKAGYDLIGGAYTTKRAVQLAHYGYEGKVLLDGQIHEVQFLSTGFTGISRKLLERMVKEIPLPLCNQDSWAICYPFYEDGYRNIPGLKTPDLYLSEDWDFCQKARQIGVKPFVDTAIRLTHWGPRGWTVNDL